MGCKHLLALLLVTCSSFCIFLVSSCSDKGSSNCVPSLERCFARKFYQRLALESGGGNLLVVPLAVHTTLVTLLEGAHGADRVQLMQILGIDHLTASQQNRVNPGYQAVLKNNNGSYQMPIKFYLDYKFRVNQDYSKFAKDYFEVEIENIDMGNKASSAKNINDFMMRVSNHTIRETIKEDDISDESGLLSVSSFHLKSPWIVPFQLSQTEKKDFYTKDKIKQQVSMMYMRRKLHFVWDGSLNAKILVLDLYKNLSMALLLPDETEGVFELENTLSHLDITPVLQMVRFTPAVLVEVWLPKFTLEADFYLETALKQMGLANLFTPGADLSGISCCGDLHVSKIRHKSFLVIGECGLEVPCSTVLDPKNLTDDEQRLSQEFHADHPFLFFILKADTVLVQGRVVQP